MLCNYSVGVWNRAASTKVNGVTIPGVPAWVRDIDVDMQPYSTELLIKTYGYDIPVTKRFFIEDISGITIGTILKYGSDSHEVKKIIPWDDYYDVMTLEVT
jgi:hypothetical protein